MCAASAASTQPTKAATEVPISRKLKRAEPAKTKLQTPTGLKRIRNFMTLLTTSFTSSTTSSVVLLRPSALQLGSSSPNSTELTITDTRRLAAASATRFLGTSWSKIFNTASVTVICCIPSSSAVSPSNGATVQLRKLREIAAPSTAATTVVKPYKHSSHAATSRAPGNSRIRAMDWTMPQAISGSTTQVKAFSQSFLVELGCSFVPTPARKIGCEHVLIN